MLGECIPYWQIPGASRLVTDFLYSFDRVARFYGYDPWDKEALFRRLERLQYPSDRRARLVEVLRVQNPGCEAVERLAEPSAVAVVTGQQVGLLTGPAYTFYKALTAVRVAEELSAMGAPAVPIFWMATEDHDYKEVAECWVFDGEGRPVRIEAGWSEGAGWRPVGEVILPEWPVGVLEEAWSGAPHGRQALEMVRRAYRPGRRWAAAFAELLGNVVGPGRLLFFDPLGREAREFLAPALARAAEQAPALVAAVRERTAELERCGYEAQVRVGAETSLFFIIADGRRVRAGLSGGALEWDGVRLEGSVLAENARNLSAGALLRPVVQDWAFPSAVNVVGPAEIAYLGQAGALYEVLDVEVPVRRPRASCTLIEKGAAEMLERYGLVLGDLFGSEQALQEAVGARLRPAAVVEALGISAAGVTAGLDRIGRALEQWRGPVRRAFEKSRGKILYQMGKIERAVAREALRRDPRAMRDLRWLSDQLYPRRRLQERVYSIMAFLARHGGGLTAALRDRIAWDCPGHQTVVI
jgi:bacillithiol biosynthesis cysteine-adding enzyme BshC